MIFGKPFPFLKIPTESLNVGDPRFQSGTNMCPNELDPFYTTEDPAMG